MADTEENVKEEEIVVNEAVEAAKPAMHHMADCMREEWHGLGESSHHMASQLRQKLEKEAKRVFSKLPSWQPGHKDGEFITKTLIFPITRN